MEKYKKFISIVLLMAAGLICLLSLATYHPHDISFYTTETNYPVYNWIGPVGAWISFGLFICFGSSAFLIPVFLFGWAVVMFVSNLPARPLFRVGGGIVLLVLLSAWLAILPVESDYRISRGGLIGFLISNQLMRYLGQGGAYIVILTGIVLSAFLATGHYFILLFEKLFQCLKTLLLKLPSLKWRLPSRPFSETGQKQPRIRIRSTVRPEKGPALNAQSAVSSVRDVISEKSTARSCETAQPGPGDFPEGDIIVKQYPQDLESKIRETEKQRARREKKERKRLAREQHKITAEPEDKTSEAGVEYQLPGIDLLNVPPPVEQRKIEEDLQASARILEDTLKDFGIECKVEHVERGPVVTRYEITPAPGVKVHRITALSDDIALTMKAHSVRIVAPIPGKAAVGVEIPNVVSSLVYMKELLESEEFHSPDTKLTLALGKDISGTPIVADLSDMPHLLIAGTTGSGKTVCVNSLIVSLLFKLTPDEVKFIMVDPKMVELAVFNGLPHLLCPVVTEPMKVSGALTWVVNEMERRYRIFAKMGVRNISAYHQQYRPDEFAGLEETDEDALESGLAEEQDQEDLSAGRLPYIIVIIDELADLMVVASADIENAITRLAQLSRAVGIHIILATQRPSVDVVTGVIKANFPARISFKVASKVDSRTVLDMNGAEKLLGKGDMLFLKPGTSKPIRAQGTLICDDELERVVEFIKAQWQVEYSQQILAHQKKKSILLAGSERDELFDEAVKLVLESGQASVSILQRRLRLGYTRAARLIDQMEAEGIIGQYQGSKPREILVKRPDGEGDSQNL